MPETASTARAASNPRIMLRAALPLQNFSLQLLCTYFFLLIFRLRRPLILRASAEPCGIQLLPQESRLASAGPLAYLQDSGAAQSIRDVRVAFRSNSGDGCISARCGAEIVFCLPFAPYSSNCRRYRAL